MIGRKAKEGDIVAMEILGNYSYLGNILQMKVNALSLLAESVSEADKFLLPYFEHYLEFSLFEPIYHFQELAIEPTVSKMVSEKLEHFKAMAYWSIDPLLKISGKESYKKLVEIALSPYLPTELRAKAIKC